MLSGGLLGGMLLGDMMGHTGGGARPMLGHVLVLPPLLDDRGVCFSVTNSSVRVVLCVLRVATELRGILFSNMTGRAGGGARPTHFGSRDASRRHDDDSCWR